MSLYQVVCSGCRERIIYDTEDNLTKTELELKYNHGVSVELNFCDFDCLERWLIDRKVKTKFELMHSAVKGH